MFLKAVLHTAKCKQFLIIDDIFYTLNVHVDKITFLFLVT